MDSVFLVRARMRCVWRPGRAAATGVLPKASSNATGGASLVLGESRRLKKKRRPKHLVKNDKLRENSALTERILFGLGIDP